MTEAGIARAIDDIEGSALKNDRVLVVYLPDIHESVAGLIAGKLREKYEKPSIVFTDGADGIKGSGRSIEAYNMYDELAAHRDLYAKFGGHKMAAGLTLAGDVVDELRYRLNEACTLSEADMKTLVMIDVELPLAYPSYAFVSELSRLEPCGNGNPKPVFGLRYLKVNRVEKSRNERAPLTINVTDKQGVEHNLKLFDRDGLFLSGADLFYGRGTAGDLCDGIKTDVMIDVLYTPGINDFRGNKSIEFIVNDYRFRRPE